MKLLCRAPSAFWLLAAAGAWAEEVSNDAAGVDTPYATTCELSDASTSTDSTCKVGITQHNVSHNESQTLEETDDVIFGNLIEWVRSNGARIDRRQIVKRESPTNLPQLYASEYIPQGTVLASIPWDLVLGPADPESEELCDTVEVVQQELNNPNSDFAHYTRALKYRAETMPLPDGWSQEGRDALSGILGDWVGPQDIGRHREWWEYYCGGDRNADPVGFMATMMVVQFRTPYCSSPSEEHEQEVMIPFHDLYNHRSGHWENVKFEQLRVGQEVILTASQNIQPGEPIHLSRSFDEPADTSEMFRDRALVPDFPQRFSFDFGGAKKLEFDINEETVQNSMEKSFVLSWVGSPTKAALYILETQLDHLYKRFQPDGDWWNGVPEHERAMIANYFEATIFAMQKALEVGADEAEGDIVWPSTMHTIPNFEVAGVNLGEYGLDEAFDPDKADPINAEPFQLFEDFDIGHLIKGSESWDDLITYRNSMQSPSLSFYVDKVARKRWLPTQGFQQVTQYALNYKFELTESGTVEDETQAIFERLPNKTDYAAKPTHHSETSGVWLVSYDAETNTTLVSSTAKQLINDLSFDNRNAAADLANNLHAKADPHESWVLKNVKPGVVVEERYVDFDNFARPPLEFCIFTIWGRVWLATMNTVVDQHRSLDGVVYRNGTMPAGTRVQEIADFVDWPHLVNVAERLGANKDMFRTDIFVGIPAGSPSLRNGASLEERKAAVQFSVSECEIYPTTLFYPEEVEKEGARLWIAGYRMGNYRTVANSEVPEEFVLTGSLSSPTTVEENASFRERCRRNPTWKGEGEADLCAVMTGYDPPRQEVFEGGTDEFPETDLVWAKRIESCMDEKARKRTSQGGSPIEPEVTAVYPPEDPVVAVVANAFTEEEVATVKDLTSCMQRYHKDNLFEEQQFTNADGDGGNNCTYLGGFLQLFAPGVARQMYHVGFLGWRAAGWGRKEYKYDHHGEKYPFPDPRVTGIRTSGHLSYEGWEGLGLHPDEESIYDVLAFLSAPSEYEGGDFFLQPSTRPNTPENLLVVKPDRLSAVVFLSEEKHGVKKILGGNRETWINELWNYGDAPVGIRRPSPAMYDHFMMTGWWE